MKNSSISTCIIINTSANDGRAAKRWERIKMKVLENMPQGVKIVQYAPPFDLKKCVRELVEEGINCFIIGGGDGTKNYLLNCLVNLYGENLSKFYLGGLGLGSSNDFHKPYQEMIEDIPVHINLNKHLKVDYGRITYFNHSKGKHETTYFVINSSIGITAEGNQFFNEGDSILNLLKSRFVGLAIVYSAIRTILFYKNKKIKLTSDDKPKENIVMSNLSIVKNPNISGNYRYNQDIKPDDGIFGLNYCHDMGKLEMIRTLFALERGDFIGRPQCVSRFVKKVHITSEKPLALETDGEVRLANDMHFEILPKSINILS